MLLGLPDFELCMTETVEETCALLAVSDNGTRVFAGGTDLFTKMKHRRLVPRRLINIKRIPELDGIRHDAAEGLRIGALATAQAIEASAAVARRFPSLKHAAGVLGTTQIRNLATIGGNLANASPSAELAPPLIVLGASVECASRNGKRRIPVEELFVGPGKTVLRQDELLTEIVIPDSPEGAQAFYKKHSLRRMDVAMASAAVLVVLDGDVCSEVKIALGAVGPTPFRARKAEQLLRGQRLTGEAPDSRLLDEVSRTAADESFPIDDFRAYATYRRKLVTLLVGKGLERVTALARA